MLKLWKRRIVEAVKNIKARIKDKSPKVSLLGLALLEQCMQVCGSHYLPRSLLLALPSRCGRQGQGAR
jgi:hypothetical protein